jgi:hypothetical protein
LQIYFSTVIRDAPPRQGGELVWLDWQARQIKQRVPITATNPTLEDPNPGSSTRGGRGVQVLDGHVIVASYHTLKVFDRALVHQHDISNPLLVGLHEICSDGADKMWVSCTALDAALQIGLKDGTLLRQFWPGEMAECQRRFGITPLVLDKRADNRTLFVKGTRYKSNRLHLNAIAMWQGEMYALLAKQGAIMNLDRQEVVIQAPALRGGHNLVIHEQGIAAVNNTYGRAILFCDLKARDVVRVIKLTEFPPVRALLRWHDMVHRVRRALQRVRLYPNTPPFPLFVRGLSLLDQQLFVGVSPASILCLNWQQGDLIDVYSYSHDVRVCVHGLQAVTDV